MYKYINFNNLRNKKRFVGGGVVVGWTLPLWKHKKQLKKHKKKKRKYKKQSILWTVKKQWKHFFIVLKKVVFENTENTKNKNTPLTPNMFLVFFVFKNRKQFLKTGTKQALNFWNYFRSSTIGYWNVNCGIKICKLGAKIFKPPSSTLATN